MLLKNNTFLGCHYWRVFWSVWVVCSSLVCCFWSFWAQKPANTLPHIQQRCFTQNILFVSCIWKHNSITLAQLPQTSRMWKNTNITLHVMCLSSQGTIWATPLLDAASGLLLPSSPSKTYLGLHPGSGNQVSPKLKVGIHKIWIDLKLEVSISAKVC